MPKEHEGGLTDCQGHATIATEWHDDEAFTVAITPFDYDSMDRVEDLVREALANGELKRFLDNYVAAHTEELQLRIIKHILTNVIEAQKPKFKLICMAIASGHLAGLRKTDEQWAKAFGVSKQDIQNGVESERAELQLRKNRTMRDEEAREKMRQGNFRPKAQVAK